MTKFFFYDSESITCETIEGIYERMSFDDIDRKTIFKAEKDDSKDYFWCQAMGEVTENDGICGKGCDLYEPRNKKSGICNHKSPCYMHGEGFEVILPEEYRAGKEKK